MMFNRSSFFAEMEARGCFLIENLLSEDLVQRCREGLLNAIDAEARYHGTNDYPDYGMVQCCAMYDQVFIDLLDIPDLMDPFNAVLGSGCIVYAYTSSSMPPRCQNFSTRIHVDCPRLIPGYLTNMGVIVPLDDFSGENGATWILPGSHTRSECPSEEEFFASAERLVARAGSAWFFNPRLWHAGGTNDSDSWRHTITINMYHPYMKQRFDIPRLLAPIDQNTLSGNALQKLGFLAQAPTSLDEYYAPIERRMFRQPYE